MSQSIETFAIGEITIRQHNGLFNLKDLHQAAGNERRHQPSNFLARDQTQALIEAIKATDNAPCIETKRGAGGGTYACRELVIAYAAWMNPSFHLKVLRVFLYTALPSPDQHELKEDMRLPLPRQEERKPIRRREDLSFVQRDPETGRLKNWCVHEGPGSWHRHFQMGEFWFKEVEELALHSPSEALDALECSLTALLPYQHTGQAMGFFNRMSNWVVAFFQFYNDIPFTNPPERIRDTRRSARA